MVKIIYKQSHLWTASQSPDATTITLYQVNNIIVNKKEPFKCFKSKNKIEKKESKRKLNALKKIKFQMMYRGNNHIFKTT